MICQWDIDTPGTCGNANMVSLSLLLERCYDGRDLNSSKLHYLRLHTDH